MCWSINYYTNKTLSYFVNELLIIYHVRVYRRSSSDSNSKPLYFLFTHVVTYSTKDLKYRVTTSWAAKWIYRRTASIYLDEWLHQYTSINWRIYSSGTCSSFHSIYLLLVYVRNSLSLRKNAEWSRRGPLATLRVNINYCHSFYTYFSINIRILYTRII